MKKVLFIILGLLAAGILGLVAMCQYTGATLKPYVEAMMVDCEAGRYQEAYDRAGEAGRAKWTFEAFQSYMQEVKRNHGAYEGLGSVKGFSSHTGTGSASSAGVTIQIQFEKGTWNGKFDFVEIDDSYKWTDLRIPDKKAEPEEPEQPKPQDGK